MPDGPVVLNNTPLVALGLPLTGTVGLLLLAKEAGLMDAVAPWIEKIQETGLYLRSDLVARVLDLAGEPRS